MIKKAKVSLSAVNSFRNSVIEVRDYSTGFDKGIACCEDYAQYLESQASSIRQSVGKMKQSKKSLIDERKECESNIAIVSARLNGLKDSLSSLEDDLSCTPEYITYTDEEGEEYEEENSDYNELLEEISDVEEEISSAKRELLPLRERLEHIKSVDGLLLAHIEMAEEIVYSLEEKKKTCKQIQVELEDIKDHNLANGTTVCDKLNIIKQTINNYLKVKMNYTDASLKVQAGMDAYNNINGAIISQELLGKRIYTEEEVKAHNILFDNNGRIISYDNKTFGGRYNSYEFRREKSMSDNNPVLGYYEGIRGESKFIPSGRSAEGIIVKEILAEYGVDGIEYRNAEPDFEVCAVEVVKIPKMSANRDKSYDNPDGTTESGNFTQADIECAKRWIETKRDGKDDWTPREVFNYRKQNRLTWHEKCDTETMVMVRTEINSFFKHSGGCSECKTRDNIQDGGGFDE